MNWKDPPVKNRIVGMDCNGTCGSMYMTFLMEGIMSLVAKESMLLHLASKRVCVLLIEL